MDIILSQNILTNYWQGWESSLKSNIPYMFPEWCIRVMLKDCDAMPITWVCLFVRVVLRLISYWYA